MKVNRGKSFKTICLSEIFLLVFGIIAVGFIIGSEVKLVSGGFI